jgi:hypothetical protein
MIDQSLQLAAPCTFTKSDRAKDHRGVDLISDALPVGRLWYGEPGLLSSSWPLTFWRPTVKRLQSAFAVPRAGSRPVVL